MGTIRFSAKESWKVADLHNFFHQLNILYNRLYVVSELSERGNAKLATILDNSLARVRDEQQLSVDYVEIHSPAQFSFIGLDKTIKQIRSLIKDLWYENRLERTKMENAIAHQGRMDDVEIAKARTELIETQIRIMKASGYSAEEIKENTKKLVDPFDKLIVTMREKEVRLLENEENT